MNQARIRFADMRRGGPVTHWLTYKTAPAYRKQPDTELNQARLVPVPGLHAHSSRLQDGHRQSMERQGVWSQPDFHAAPVKCKDWLTIHQRLQFRQSAARFHHPQKLACKPQPKVRAKMVGDMEIIRRNS